jgi:endoglucanase
MKKIYSIVFLIFIFSLSLLAQTTPHKMVTKMGRGINLGNVLSAPIEGNWAPPVQESYFEDIAVVGFKTVRIPIRFDTQTTPFSSVAYKDANGNYIGNVSNYNVNASYLDRIEQVVDWALSKGLIAIIDVHGDHWYWESYKLSSPNYKTGADLLAAEDRFKAIWTAISVRFQNKSENLLFEIMNEPYFSMSAVQANTTNLFILPIIRATNPTRNVIITSGGKNSFETPTQISDAVLYSDSYLIPTFHYYHPRAFTASGEETHTDNNWGTQADKDAVIADFTVTKNWALSKNVPMFLGEFGADNENGINYSTNTPGLFGGPDAVSRMLFHKFIADLAISYGFSLAVWDSGDKASKTVYKQQNRDWVVDVRNAVLNTQCLSSDLIDNSDVECNFDYGWQLSKTNGASARINNATTTEAFNNSKSIRITVTTVGSSPESVLLNNKTATTGFIIGKEYSFNCFAKGTNNQPFYIRIKAFVNGLAVYQTSPVYTLSSVYQKFDFSYTVQPNTTSLEFQVMCGSATGDYYFDNFLANINSSLNIIQTELPLNTLKIYKNNEILTIKSSYQNINSFAIFDLQGRLLIEKKECNSSSIDIDNLKIKIQVILVKVTMTNGGVESRKFIY